MIELPTADRPLTLRMNSTRDGHRCEELREIMFVLAELVGLDDYDWVYSLLDVDGALWRASVSIWSDNLWLLVDETAARYWVEQPYPVVKEHAKPGRGAISPSNG